MSVYISVSVCDLPLESTNKKIFVKKKLKRTARDIAAHDGHLLTTPDQV